MKRVLIVAPHGDDEVLGVGGTIQKHVQSGDQVFVCIVCDRENQAVQNQQTIEAMRLLNVPEQHVDFLGLEDEQLDEHGSRRVIKRLEHVYVSRLPNVVYYCHYDDINTDHYMVNRACDVAFRALQQHTPDQIILYETPSSTTQSPKKTFKPNMYSVLTDLHLEYKIAAMAKYIDEIREYPNPRSPRGLRTYAEFRGMECNAEYAEGFQIIFDRV